ncbi:hypothetical protein [Patulibacter sp.]|uniref:hypothetical protein n=1 Tax=Patulibacter sp. TaxID=1912859 RepID=UPI002727660E|nr:hypothetical protein [Patulibacter sp.]MDO9408287.1 hypothetical protein [Patulibacter sp.]
MLDSIVLSDRSRALLRCVVRACDADPGDGRAPRESIRVAAGDHRAADLSWPCDVAPPTREELTPLRMQGLIAVTTDAGDHLTVSPTPLGREAAGVLAPAPVTPDETLPASRRIAERVAELVEAEPDAEERVRLRAAWSVLGATVEAAAEDVVPERRGPRALAVRARALSRRPRRARY